jgi:tetratricopeptide (TPR) repeat protein
MKTFRFNFLIAIVLCVNHLQVQSMQASGYMVMNVNSVNLPKIQSTKDIGVVKADIAELLKEKIQIFDKTNQLTDTPEDIKVLDDGIQFIIKNQKTMIYFADLVDKTIPSAYFRKSKSILSLEKFEFISKGFNTDLKRLEELRQDLIFIQTQLRSKRDEDQRALFEKKVAEYRALKVKPPISEEQRRYIVQANSFSQEKAYGKAIEIYTKALEVDQTAYPAGYSNLALLSAQVKNFAAAINYMKKYLLLVPEAEDARAAQDKIYEWEAQLSK